MKPLPAIATPSESVLLDWLKARVSRLMLEEIAANDWGRETAHNLAGIEMQLGDSAPLGPLPWFPLEVLELERWKELIDERGH